MFSYKNIISANKDYSHNKVKSNSEQIFRIRQYLHNKLVTFTSIIFICDLL